MAGGVTAAELLAALATALASVFGEGWAVWPTPPDQTALPAVWPQFAGGSRTGSRATGAPTSITAVAAIAPQTAAAENAAIADAVDRLDTITASALGAAITAGSWVVGEIEIGQIPHTAVLYQFTLDRPLPC
jgi:hypothetical protein